MSVPSDLAIQFAKDIVSSDNAHGGFYTQAAVTVAKALLAITAESATRAESAEPVAWMEVDHAGRSLGLMFEPDTASPFKWVPLVPQRNGPSPEDRDTEFICLKCGIRRDAHQCQSSDGGF